MHIFDQQIISLLNEAVKATDEGQKRAASELVRLLRSGPIEPNTIDDLAADLARTWGPEVKGYFRELCRKVGVCD
ncbi:MAG TPA: hypothetical protein VHG92_13295 [Afifellaceae bacterium]|nr:hypothetical protein [Afifellaceae bacterium]